MKTCAMHSEMWVSAYVTRGKSISYSKFLTHMHFEVLFNSEVKFECGEVADTTAVLCCKNTTLPNFILL